MKRLIANLMVLGVLGAATAATAQELTPAQREARAREAQANRAPGLTPAQRYDRTHGLTPGQRYDRNHGLTPAQQDQRLTPGQRYNRAYGLTPAQQAQRNANWAHFQGNLQAERRFHGGFYRPPPGYYYRRWGWGQTLPRAFWGENYWINNFAIYGLIAPPPGLIWVRYGPDALLINRWTGQIVRVRYGVFY